MFGRGIPKDIFGRSNKFIDGIDLRCSFFERFILEALLNCFPLLSRSIYCINSNSSHLVSDNMRGWRALITHELSPDFLVQELRERVDVVDQRSKLVLS